MSVSLPFTSRRCVKVSAPAGHQNAGGGFTRPPTDDESTKKRRKTGRELISFSFYRAFSFYFAGEYILYLRHTVTRLIALIRRFNDLTIYASTWATVQRRIRGGVRVALSLMSVIY